MVAMHRAARAKLKKEWLQEVLHLSLLARATLTTLLSYGCSFAGVAGCTWLAFSLGFNVAASGFLYLVAVVLAAVYAGVYEATITSLVSAACLNYFFIPPIWSFHVRDPADWVALGT